VAFFGHFGAFKPSPAVQGGGFAILFDHAPTRHGPGLADSILLMIESLPTFRCNRGTRPTRMKLALALLLPLASFAADSLPDPAGVTAAMKKATAFCTSKLANHGGYASAWSRDLSMAKVEGHESKTVISIQPPGTTTLGLVWVKAFQATGDVQFLNAARGAARALAECQLASGGWGSDFDFEPEAAKKYYLHQQALAGDAAAGKRKNLSTLDDNKTQSALRFLLELAHLPECRDDKSLQDCLKFGLDSLLAAQYPNGGWPQQFDAPADPATPVLKAAYPKTWSRTFPRVNYVSFYTLNDGNMQKVVELLLRAHELTRDERFLNAAKKTGDFFILAQMPEPQPGWAQQYNHQMEPVWARKFEPPCVTGSESLGAVSTLHELYVVTGDEKYLKPLPAAFAWYEKSRLPDGMYARFYELQTNKPLYFVKDTYELTYSDANMPTHYGFKLDDLEDDIVVLRELVKKPREELLAKRSGPADEKSWTSKAKGAAKKVTTALTMQQPDGYWLKGDEIDAGEFSKYLMAMANYVEAAKKGGETFARQRR
jgi:PelA/Pel-15E family pectate lyase